MEWVEDSPRPHANFSLPMKNQLRILTHATKFIKGSLLAASCLEAFVPKRFRS